MAIAGSARHRFAAAQAMALSQAVLIGEKAYVLRELQPSEDQITISPKAQSMSELTQL
jgi:hypothetical protein